MLICARCAVPLLYVRSNGLEDLPDLELHPGVLIAETYLVISSLGKGTFSRVFECIDRRNERSVAVKVLRNDKACLDAGLSEIRVLAQLEKLLCPEEPAPHARLLDYFYFKEHLLIVTDLLGCSLLGFNKIIAGEPCKYFLPNRLAVIASQLLTGLKLMHDAKMVHCDLKPDNVCFASISQCIVKLIDFGSCLCEHDTRNSYMQSRWYRAPEVMLGMRHDEKIDIWSLGCMLAELLLGYPLFHENSAPKVLAAQHAVLGPYPASLQSLIPESIRRAYFSPDGSLYEIDPPGQPNGVYQLQPLPTTLHELIPLADPRTINFILSLLQYDPATRPSAAEVLKQPFITAIMQAESERASARPASVADGLPPRVEITPDSAQPERDSARGTTGSVSLTQSRDLWSNLQRISK